MAFSVLVPQVGQDLTVGKIVALNVAVGDDVKKGDIVAEVESEKAVFEVEAFEAGTVLDILYEVDQEAPVLEPLMFLGTPGENLATAAKDGAVVDADPDPQANGVIALATQSADTAAVAPDDGHIIRSSPLARRLAAKHGLDLGTLIGTGPKRSIVKRDVMSALEARAGTPETPSLATAPAPLVADLPGLVTLREGVADPVLFVHGFGAELAIWRPFVERTPLSNALMALDLPTHGSAGSSEGVADFDALTDRIAATLDQAGASRLHLVGHSLGAAVVAALAGRGTLDVRSLTLIAPAGLGPWIDGAFIDGFLAADSAPALSAWMAMAVHDRAKIPDAMIRATLAAREGSELAARQRALAAALFSRNTQLFSVRDALDRFEGPARVIVGANDRIVPPAQTDGLPAQIALHMLPGVGHQPHIEAMGLVARLVTQTVRSAG